MATGDWFKISVQESGVHKITYNQLVESGLDVDNIDPQNIKLYGNGGGMIPEKNSTFVYDDLHENAIMLVDGDDGSFDEGDYMLFYDESPDQWVYNPNNLAFERSTHRYSDYTYYFITAGEGSGKGIRNMEQSAHPASITITSFHDFAFHELNEENLIHSGATWYGKKFGEVLTYHFPFEFPYIDPNNSNYLVANVAEKSIIPLVINTTG